MRRPVGGRKYAKKFNRSRKYGKSINSPSFVMRGGIRL